MVTTALAPMDLRADRALSDHMDFPYSLEPAITFKVDIKLKTRPRRHWISRRPSKRSDSSIESQLPTPGPGVEKKRGVQPHTAKKLATNVAILSAMVMTPFRSLMSQMSSDVDFAEIACAPTSSLSASMEEMGYNIQRINFKEGYDLDRKSGTQKVGAFMKREETTHTWVSLPCTRLSSLVNLTQRDEHEEAAFKATRPRSQACRGDCIFFGRSSELR